MSSKEMAKAAAAKAGLNRTQFPFFLPPLFLDLGMPCSLYSDYREQSG